jgi:predicted house-cleaning noncanonical NTP pyrophosphatase (MazG superfamily)
MIYNKLVRDKIPEIIRQQGEIPNCRILDQKEYLYFLEQKLDEEVGEYHRDQNVEELADILEVVFSLADGIGSSREELMDVYQRKHDDRGGFHDRIFLISKE